MAPDDLMSLDFSLDLAIYAVFTLLITTATFWRITWKAVRREQPRSQLAKILITSAAVHVAREILIIKVRWWRDYFEVRTGMPQATKGKQEYRGSVGVNVRGVWGCCGGRGRRMSSCWVESSKWCSCPACPILPHTLVSGRLGQRCARACSKRARHARLK